MNLEIILWVASWILVSEIIFIFLLKNKSCKEMFYMSNWVVQKLFALAFGVLFIIVQVDIVSEGGEPSISNFGVGFHYINLLYELIIIIGVGVLFFINKKIADKINGV
jgi:hypothetical protein